MSFDWSARITVLGGGTVVLGSSMFPRAAVLDSSNKSNLKKSLHTGVNGFMFFDLFMAKVLASELHIDVELVDLCFSDSSVEQRLASRCELGKSSLTPRMISTNA